MFYFSDLMKLYHCGDNVNGNGNKMCKWFAYALGTYSAFIVYCTYSDHKEYRKILHYRNADLASHFSIGNITKAMQ